MLELDTTDWSDRVLWPPNLPNKETNWNIVGHVKTWFAESRVAQPPGSNPLALRIATHGQQGSSLVGEAASLKVQSVYSTAQVNKAYLIIIIIIMSHQQHGSHWSSPFTLLYGPSLPEGFRGYILYRHRDVVSRFELGVRPLLVHVKVVHWSMSLMNSSLLPQQCPVCLVRLIRKIFVMGGKWPYSCYFVGCCLQNLFNIARSIFV